MTFHPAAPPHELLTQTHTHTLLLRKTPSLLIFLCYTYHVQDPRYDFFYDAHSATAARCFFGEDGAPFAVVGSS